MNGRCNQVYSFGRFGQDSHSECQPRCGLKPMATIISCKWITWLPGLEPWRPFGKSWTVRPVATRSCPWSSSQRTRSAVSPLYPVPGRPCCLFARWIATTLGLSADQFGGKLTHGLLGTGPKSGVCVICLLFLDVFSGDVSLKVDAGPGAFAHGG